MHEVAIIGYGPVGATLAALLGRLGVDVVVFDKNFEIYPMPRAVGFDHDAMRLFQCAGVSEAIRPFIEPFREEIYLGADGRVLQHFKHMPKPYPLTWDPHFTCDQPGIERELRTQISSLPNVQVHLGYEFQFFEQHADSVTIHLENENRQPETFRAKYLVGCDGASSAIRSQLKIDLENLNYDEPWLVVDMKVKEAYLDKLPLTNVQYCNPVRPSTLICCPGNHRRWEFMKLPSDSPDALIAEEQLWALMSPWINPGEADIWRAASYRFHALVARQWHAGRVFLAGDSAHQTPPFLGQGMCQGLRDAGNLAWKLHHVVSGRAQESLLTTYSQERRPNVVATTQLAKDCGLMISERDVAKARARDEEISLATAGLGRIINRQELIPTFEAGFLETSAPLSGSVFPQPVAITQSRSPVLMDDLLPPCFHLVLLADQVDPTDLDEICTASSQLGIFVVAVQEKILPKDSSPDQLLHMQETIPLIKTYLMNGSCIGAIVRPDHYVYCGVTDTQNALDAMATLAEKLQFQN
jgi:3-(3-hydroxy-phenyl)propionate hydroxylase